MKNKKTLKTLAVLLAGIIAGGAIGLGVGFRFGMKSGILLGSTVEYDWFQGLAKVVLSESDCEGVRQALESYLAMRETAMQYQF